MVLVDQHNNRYTIVSGTLKPCSGAIAGVRPNGKVIQQTDELLQVRYVPMGVFKVFTHSITYDPDEDVLYDPVIIPVQINPSYQLAMSADEESCDIAIYANGRMIKYDQRGKPKIINHSFGNPIELHDVESDTILYQRGDHIIEYNIRDKNTHSFPVEIEIIESDDEIIISSPSRVFTITIPKNLTIEQIDHTSTEMLVHCKEGNLFWVSIYNSEQLTCITDKELILSR